MVVACLLLVGTEAQAADPASNALPTNGQVAAGSASISTAGTAAAPVMNVNQTSQHAVVNWEKFDVGSASTVNFNQPNAQASTLNRISDPNPSKIFGKINAPGTVILMNQQGVYFAPGATVDVGSVVATSHDISNQDYMDGKATYDRNGATGKVINEGNIKTALGGYVALLAPEVRNTGVIVAQMGTVVLAAGERITLNFDPSRHLASITTTSSTIDALIENHNAVKAPGGLIILSAKAVNTLTAGVIKNSGTLSASADANTITNKGGRILLTANTVKLEAGSQTVARGPAGGGTVEIKATQTATVEATAKVSVSATQTGDAGTITIHADEKTTINGTLLAQGGKQSGNGGVINTTSNGQVEIGNTAAIKAGVRGTTGNVGTWNLIAAAMQINTTNAGVISESLNHNSVNLKATTAMLSMDADATIQKTSPRLTSLNLDGEQSVTIAGQILSNELSPITIQILSQNLVELKQTSAIQSREVLAAAPNVISNGDIYAYLFGGNNGSIPLISFLASRISLVGNLRAGSNGRAGKINLQGLDQVSISNANILSNGNDGGEVLIVSMNGTVSLINSVIQTNGGEGRGGAISVAGLQSTILSVSTLEATGKNQGGTILVGNDAKNGTLPFSAYASLDANTVLNAQALNAPSNSSSNQIGGFIETSGHVLNLLATINAGRGGMWLIDPNDVTIASASPAGDAYTNSYVATQSTTILASNIVSSLNAGVNVSISTGSNGTALGVIYVNTAISATGSGALTLNAGSSFIYLGANVTTGGAQNYTGNVLITSAITLTSTNSNITFDNNIYALTNTASLTIDAGTGNVTVTGRVGYVSGAMTAGATTAQLSNGGSGNLDTSGLFVYAAAFGTTTSKTIGDITFVNFDGGTGSTSKNGVTVYNDQVYAAWGGTYSSGNATLETLLQSMVWSNSAATNAANSNYGGAKLGIDLTGLIPNATYKIQLLSSESCCVNRYWNVDFNNGALITNTSNIIFTNFYSSTGVTNTAMLGSYVFTAANTVANVTLNGLQAGTTSPTHDPNVVISAMSLEIQSFAFSSLSVKGGQVSLNGNVTASSSLTINNSLASTISSVLSGAASLTKAGAGSLTLSGANTYTGMTTINGGTLSVSSLADGGTVSGIGQSTNAATNLVINGGTLQYTGGDISTNRLFTVGANGATIDASGTGLLTLSNAGSIGTTASTNPTLTLTGSGSGSLASILANPATSGKTGLTKAGTGLWSLSGTNTYTGITSINGGTLSVSLLANGGTASGIGQSTNVSTNLVINGGTLQFTGSAQSTDRLFTIGASGATIDASGTGALTFTNTGIIDKVASTSPTLTLTGSGSATLSQSWGNPTSGTSSLSKTGTGTWILSNNGNGTPQYTGATSILGGVLSVVARANGNPVAGSLYIDGATLRYAGSGCGAPYSCSISGITFTISANGATLDASGTGTGVFSILAPTVTDATNPTLILTGTGSGTLSSAFNNPATSGTSTLTKTGTGLWTLAGSSNYTGVTTISAGTLSVATLANGGTASGLGKSSNAASNLVIDGGTLQYTGMNVSTDRLFTIGANGARIDSSGSQALTFSNTGSLVATAGSSPTITLTGTANATLNSVLADPATSGVLTLIKTGSNYWTLGAANTYTGTTTISQGTVNLANANALGLSTTNVDIRSGAILYIGAYTIDRKITLGGGSIYGTGTLTGDITLTANSTFYGASSSTPLTVSSLISDAGLGFGINVGVTTNAYLVKLSNVNNNYSGSTTVNYGTLMFGNANAIPTTSNLIINPSGTLDSVGLTISRAITLSGGTVTNSVSGGSYTGAITLTANSTLYAQNGPGVTIAGAGIGESGGSWSVKVSSVTGSGNVTYSVANTYTGTTNIISATLKLGANNALDNMSAVVLGGPSNPGTLDLNGYTTSKIITTGTYSARLFNSTGNGEATGGITINAPLTISTNRGTTLKISGAAITGLNKSVTIGEYCGSTCYSDGTIIFANTAANTYLGSTGVNYGTLQLGAATANLIPSGTTLTVSAGATFDVAGYSFNGALTLGNTGSVISSTGTTGELTGGVVITTGANGYISAAAGSVLTIKTTAISGSTGSVVFGTATNTGTVVINSATTFTGSMTISYGTVKGGNAAALGPSTGAGNVIINSGAVLDLNGQALTNSGSLTINGTGISSSGALMNSSATGASYSGLLVVGSDSTIVAGTGAIALTNTGSIIGASRLTLDGAQGGSIASILATTSGQLIKNGSGTWVLSGVNTYSGATTINAGTLQLGTGGTLSSSTPVTMSGSANFDLNGNNVSLYSLTGATTNLIYNSKVGTTATLNVSGATTTTYAGVIADNTGTGGSIALTRSGSGALVLSGSNTYTGITTISGGILAISSDANLGAIPSSVTANAITLSGGELQATAAVSLDAKRGVTLTAASTLTATTGNTFTVNGIIDGAFGLSINKASLTGTVILAGANTYSGNTNIVLGTLKAGSATAIGLGNASVTSGAVFDLNGQTMTSTGGLTLNGAGVGSTGALINSSATGATYAGLITLGSASSIVGGAGTITISNTGTITGANYLLTLDGAQGGSIASIIGTTGGVTKQGAGTWLLSGLNTYTGATAVAAGTLKVGSAAALGANTSTTTVSSGAVLDMNGTSMTNTNTLSLSGTGISSSGALINSSATSGGYAGSISIAAATTIGVSSGAITLSGAMSGSSGLTKVGVNALTLSGANSSFTGGVTINEGTLKVGSATGLGGNSSAVSVTSGAVLDLNGITMTNTNALTLNGTGTGDGVLINSNSTTGATYAGLIGLGNDSTIGGAGTVAITNAGTISGATKNLTLAGAGGSIGSVLGMTSGGNLIVSSTGAWTLSKANTYTGTTTIKAGTLILAAAAPSGSAGALGNASSAVLLGDTSGSSNASLVTNGAYTIARNITVQSGNTGTITIGGTGAFTSVFSGNITLNKEVSLTADSSGLANFSGTSGQLSGAAGINKVGAGIVLLSTYDTYSGATSIYTGTLRVGNAVALGTTPTISVGAGATLDLNGLAITMMPALTLNGSGVGGAGAITNSSATAASFSGTVTLGSASAIGSTFGAITLSSNVTDTNNYGLVFVGNKAISLTSTGNTLSIIASAASIGALTVVNRTALNIDSVVLGGVTYTGISSTGLISVKVSNGNLNISQNVSTTSNSAVKTSPALLLSAGGTGELTNNIVLSGTPTFSVGTGGIADFYSGISTSSTGLNANVEGLSPNSFTYGAGITTQPTAAGYNVIYRGGMPIYINIVSAQSGTYGVASPLQYWYSTSATSYGTSFVPTVLQANYGTVQTFTAGATSVTINANGLTGTITLGGDVSSLSATLDQGTYSVSLTPSNTMAMTSSTATFMTGGSKNFVVNPATLVVTSASNSATYNGAVQTNTGGSIKVNGGASIPVVNGAVLTGIGSDAFALSGYGYGTNASQTTYLDNLVATASGTTKNSNYTISYVNAGGGLTINKATLTYTATAATSVYGSTPSVNAGRVTGFVNNETDAVLGGAMVFTTPATATSNVGRYAINGAGYTSDNYQFVQASANATALTIGKATLTYVATAATSIYGSTPSVNAGTVNGFVNNETASVLTGTMLFSTPATGASSVGSYAINGSGLSSGNYQFVQDTGNSSALTINQKSLTVTANAQSTTYGSALTLGTSAFTTSGLVNSDTVTAVTLLQGGNSVIPSTQTAGTYNNGIIASGATGNGLSNYSIAYSPGTLTINKATLTVTADNKTRVYGDSNPSFTYTISGYKNSEDANSAALTGTPSISSTATAASGVNTYTITSAANDLAATNYQFIYANGTLTVNRRPVTVTGDNKVRIYGAANPTLTYTIAADGSGSSRGLYSTDSLTGNLATSATASANVGTPAITQGTLTNTNNGNYDITYNNGTLTINKATLTYTATAATSVYGSTPSVNAGTVTGFVNNETASVLTGTMLFSTTATGTSNVGSYAINGSGYSATNYDFVQAPGNATALTINKATLTYTATAATSVYGSTPSVNAGTVTGFVNNETASVLTGTMLFSTTATGTSNVGSYAINGSGYSATNYDFVQAPGNATALTIGQKALTITASADIKIYGSIKTYGAGSTAFTSAGLVNSETIGSVTITDTNSGGLATANAGGSYALTPSLANGGTFNAANYSITYAAGALTVNTKALTVAAASQSTTYGTALVLGTNNTVATRYNVTGLVNSDAVTAVDLQYSGNGTVLATTAANTYTNGIVASNATGTGLSNYTISYSPADLVVNAKALTITANADSKTYGATKTYGAGSTAFTSSGLVNNETISSVTITDTNGGGLATANAGGTYALTPSAAQGINTSNYSITYSAGGLTVNKVTLTVAADAKTMTYGASSLPSLTATITGFVNGQNLGTSGVTGSASLSTTATPYDGSTAGSASVVGNYTITPTQGTLAATNYDFTYLAGTLSVGKANLTITAANDSKIYGASTTAANIAYTNGVAANVSTGYNTAGLVNGDTISSATLTSTGANATATVAGGPYTITPSVLTGSSRTTSANYNITYTNASTGLTVNPATLTYTATAATSVYGSTPSVNAGSVTGFVNGDTQSTATTGTILFSTTATANTNVGSYAINGSGLTSNTSNYVFAQAAGNATALTISPFAVTIEADRYYDGTRAISQSDFIVPNGLNANGERVYVATGNATVSSANIGNYSNVTFSNLTIRVDDGFGGTRPSANYTFNTTGGVQIVPAPLTISLDAKTMTYGGTVPTLTFTYTGQVTGETPNFTGSLYTYVTSTTGAGSHPIGLGTLQATGNYTVPRGVNQYFVPANLVVNPAPLNLTISKVYNGTADFTSANTYSLTGMVNNDPAPLISGGTAATSSANAGTYHSFSSNTLTLSDHNYTVVGGNFTATVNPATLTLVATPTSSAYGSTPSVNAGTVTGFVNNETGTALSGTLVFSTPATASSPIGLYAINGAGLTANNGNYVFVQAAANATALNIVQANLVITPTNQTGTYGTALNLGTSAFTATGLLNGDSVTSVALLYGGNSVVPATLAAGTYTNSILASGATGSAAINNYSISYNTANLTINKATLTVSADNQTKTYGDVNPALTYTISGYVNNQNFGNAGITGTASTSTTVTQGSDVGTYAISTVANNLAAANYQFAYQDGTLTVNRRPVTVTADNKTKTYGDVNPILTYSIAANGVGTSRGMYNGQTLTGEVATAATQATGVGTPSITQGTLTNTNNANYDITFTSGTLTINPAQLTVTANADAKFVTQADATNFNGAHYSGFVNGDTASNLSGTLSVVRSNAAQNNAGVYSGVLQPSGLSSTNYTITYAAGNYTITPAETLLVDVNNQNITYGNTPIFVIGSVKYLDGQNVIHTLTQDSHTGNTYTYSDGVGGSATFTLTTNATSSTSNNLVVGNYSLIGANFSKVSNNFNNSPVYTGNLAVEQKALTAGTSSVSKVYDGSASMANLNISLNPIIAGDVVTASGQGAFSQASVGQNLSYSVSNLALTGTDSGNYYLFGGTSFSGANGEITKAPLGIAVTASYNGTSTVTPSAVTVTGLVNNETLNVTSVGLNAANVAANATNYVTSIAASSGTASLANYNLTLARNATLATTTTNKVTLDPVAITVTANNQSRVYGAANPTSGAVTLTAGTLYGGDTLSTATLTSAALATTAAGQTAALVPSSQSFTVADAAQNYTITYANGTLSINKAPIGIQVAGTYNGTTTIAPSSVTITGLANGETLNPSAVLVNDKNVAANGSNFVTAITPTVGDTASLSNYELTSAYNGTLATITTNTVTINKANLTVSATPSLTGNVYNGNAYTAAYTTTAVNGETFTVTGQAAGTNAGTYASSLVVTGAALANYNTPTISDANLVISPKAVTITNAASSTTYDGATSYADLMNSAGFTHTALVGSDTISSVTQTATVNGSIVTGVAQAGTFVSAPSVAVMGVGLGTNYAFTYQAATNTVAKANLSVTAANATKTYNGLAYTGGNGVTYSGLVNNESSTVLTGILAYSGTSQNAIDAGSYVITPSGLSSNNYDITYANGSLTVNKANLSVTAVNATKTYNGLAYTGGNGVIYSGLVNNEASTVLTGTLAYSGTSQNAIDAGSYVITPSGLSSNNYDISYANGSLTVNKATLTVTANAQSRVYGDANPSFTQTIAGFVNGQTLATSGVTGSAYGSSTATAASNVGSYTITASANGLSSANYQFTTTNGILTVNARPITVTADAKTKVYGSANPALTYAVAADGVGTSRGLYGSDSLSGALSVNAGTATPVGNVAIAQNTLSNTNYAITYVADNLTITPATLSVTGYKTYDGSIVIAGSDLTVTGVNGERFTATGNANLSSKNVQVNQNLADVNGIVLTPLGSALVSNYAPLDVTNTQFTVYVKAVTLTAPSITKTYDGGYAYTMTTADLTSMASQLVGGDSVSAASVSFATNGAGTNKRVDLNSVTISDGNGGANYSVTRSYSTTSRINPAPLTIKAADDAKFVTTSDVVGYSGVFGDGFVNGEGLSNLTAPATIITRSNPSVNGAGNYVGVLVPGLYTSANYTITYQNGDYTIVPAQTLLIRVAPTNVTYGDITNLTSPAYTYTAQYLPAATQQNQNPTPVTLTPTAPVNGLYTLNDGASGAASFKISAVNPNYSSTNRLAVGGYDMVESNVTVTGNNFLAMLTVGALTVAPKVISATSLGISGVSKVYDGSAAISGTLLNVNAANSQVLSGDRVDVYATGSYNDANVGTAKSIVVDVSLSTPSNLINDAANYSLSSTRVTGNLGTITQLAQVTWTGGGSSNNWSNASNWLGGAIPTFSIAANMPNVANVIIPAGANVVYDSASVGNSGSAITNNGTLTFNGANNFTFTDNVSGSGNLSLSGAGTLTLEGNNTYLGATNIHSSTLMLGSVNALSANVLITSGGKLGLVNGITLPGLTVNGDVTLVSDIRTSGAQIYNGKVGLGQSLSLAASAVTFNDSVGKVGTIYANYVASHGADIYNLAVLADSILINADVTTYGTQTYGSSTRAARVVIGDNGRNGTTRVLLSEDPAVTFYGTIDDSVANTHDLIVKAVTYTGLETPTIDINGNVGSITPLKSLTTDVGLQDSALGLNSIFSRIALGSGQGIGRVTINGTVSTAATAALAANNNRLAQANVSAALVFKQLNRQLNPNSNLKDASVEVGEAMLDRTDVQVESTLCLKKTKLTYECGNNKD